MKKKVRIMSTRILSLISSFVVLLSFFSFPAFATSTDEVTDQSAFEPLFTDMLNYPEFTMSQGNISVVAKQPIFGAYANQGPIRFSWGDGTYRYYYGYLLIGIAASRLPDSVQLGTSGSYVGQLVGVDTGVYTYKINLNTTALDRLSIYVDMGSYAGSVQITYAYAVNNDSIHVTDGVNFTAYALMQDAEQPYMQEYPLGEIEVPYNYVKRYSVSSNPSEFYVNVEYVFHSAAIEEMSFLFASPNVWPNYYEDNTFQIGGFSLVDLAGGTVVDIIDYSLNESTFNSTFEGMTRYSYCATVNLSGIDLTGKSLQFRVYLGSRMPSNDYIYQFVLRDIAYKLPSHDIPWYLRFFNWIKNEFTSLKEVIKSNSVKDSLDQAGDSLQDSFDNAQLQEDSVNDKVAQLQSDWTAEHTKLSSGMDVTINRSSNAMQFISDYAQRIYDNIGWFGSVYSAIGLMSVIMLLLSKSGLAHKLSHYSSSVRSGPHTGSNGGIK